MVEAALLVFGFLSLLWVVRIPRAGGQAVHLEPAWYFWDAYSLVGISSAIRSRNRSMVFWPLVSKRRGEVPLLRRLLGPIEENVRPEETEVLPCPATGSAHPSASGAKPLALASRGGDGFSLGLCSHGLATSVRLGRSWLMRFFNFRPSVPR